MRVANITRGLIAIFSLFLGSGCVTHIADRQINSRLSPSQVKLLATAKARANGFKAEATDTWMIALQPRAEGYVWSAQMIPTSGASPVPPCWFYVDDATGHVEFVMPVFKGEQIFAKNADWLFKVDESIKRTVFPISLERFMIDAHFADAVPTGGGGGSVETGPLYVEYTLREEKDTPVARFEIRCYYTTPQGAAGPKMVTAAEIAYIDANAYRYLLVRNGN